MEFFLNNITNQIFIFTSFINERSIKGVRSEVSTTDILKFIIDNHYSATKFKFNRRKQINAQKTKILVLDIDEPQLNYPTVEDVKNKIKDFNHVIATTKSHQVLKNGSVCDRYRILLFLSEDVETSKQYKEQVSQVANILNINHDEKCTDLGRLFFKSNQIISFNFSGYSFLPIRIDAQVEKIEKAKFQYRLADCAFPAEIEKWVNKKELGKRIVAKREELIRILICQKYLLAYNGFSQDYMAKYLNIRRNTFKVWFDDLIKHGWLTIFSDDYGKGWKSKTYSAKGELADTIMSYHGFKNRSDCYSQVELPVKIKNGEWHKVLFLSTFKFSNDEDSTNYINWVKTIDGWDRKTRLVQAHNAFTCMKKILISKK